MNEMFVATCLRPADWRRSNNGKDFLREREKLMEAKWGKKKAIKTILIQFAGAEPRDLGSREIFH